MIADNFHRHPSSAAQTSTRHPNATILDRGRCLKAAWAEHERLDQLGRTYRQLEQDEQDEHTKDALHQIAACEKTNNAAQFAIERLIATTQAKTLAEAAVQTMLACAHVDILRNEANEETGAADLAETSMRMLRSALLVMVRETGVDLAEDHGVMHTLRCGRCHGPPASSPRPSDPRRPALAGGASL
jgi:hypothetical protein